MLYNAVKSYHTFKQLTSLGFAAEVMSLCELVVFFWSLFENEWYV